MHEHEKAPTKAMTDQGDGLRARRQELGRRLRELRETRDLSTAALAQATRISRAFLEALEAGAFERLPGQVFGRGFVGGLCKHLGVDGEAFQKDYDACWETPEKTPSVLKVQIKNKPVPEASESMQALGRYARKLVRPRAAASLVAAGLVLAAAGYAVKVAPMWTAKLGRLVPSRAPAAASLEAAVPSRAPAPKAQAAEASKGGTPDEPADVPAGAEDEPDLSAAAAAAAKEAAKAEATEAATTVASAAKVEAKAETPPETPVKEAASAAQEATSAPAQPDKAEPSPQKPLQTASLGNEAGGDQVLELEVSTPVRVRLGLDGQPSETQELKAQTYRFTFKAHADVMVYDAAALKISFNGRPLGPLGNKGRVRRLSFDAAAPTEKKL